MLYRRRNKTVAAKSNQRAALGSRSALCLHVERQRPLASEHDRWAKATTR